jgi:hypothetical protein
MMVIMVIIIIFITVTAVAFYLKRNCSCLIKKKRYTVYWILFLFCVGNAVFKKQEFLTFFALFMLIALFN